MPLLRTITLAFALVVTVVWGISYFHPLVLRVSPAPQQAWFLDVSHGRLRLTRQRVTPAVVMGLTADARTLHTITLRDAAGAVAHSSRDPARRDARSPWWFDENSGNHVTNIGPMPAGAVNLIMSFVCVPMWVIVVLALVPALAAWAWEWRRRQQWLQQGRCVTCGYDLRATPEQCPECGKVPARGRPAAV